LAKLQRHSRLRIKEVLPELAQKLKQTNLVRFNPQDMANMVWAFATAGMHDAGLFGHVSSELGRRDLREFNPQALANTVWAFATAGIHDAGLFGHVSSELGRRDLRDFNTRDMANTVWAFAAADFDQPPVVSYALKLLSQRDFSFSQESLSQLHLAAVSAQLSDHSLRLPHAAVQRVAALFRASSVRQSRPSSLQQQVYKTLDTLQVSYQVEHIVEELGYSVDAALFDPETNTKVALEVDGPSHFATEICAVDTKGKVLPPLGKTLLKHRLLARSGWTVVQVPYWEWPNKPTHRVKYLECKLDKLVGAIRCDM
jgi:hypothetical protein